MRQCELNSPNGWFRVAFSHELSTNQLKTLHYFGQELIAFRDRQGQACVFDAHCPHLGAHLGHGGKVIDGTVQCPFHAWRFDGTGACVHASFSTRIPAKARLGSRQVCEINGAIFVWFHRENAAPTYQIPRIPELQSNAWYSFAQGHQIVRGNVFEIKENMVDRTHFLAVHHKGIGLVEPPDIDVWEERGPFLHIEQCNKARFAGFRTSTHASVDCYGLGFNVARLSNPASVVVSFYPTPIDAERVDWCFQVRVQRQFLPVGWLLQKLIARRWGLAFMEDHPIFEHKIFRPRPVLADGDGPIMKLRRWMSQFYSVDFVQ